MTYQRERDEFIQVVTRAGFHMDTIRALLRYATTLQRLAEAQCNGDWPADNGERKVLACSRCESLWVPTSMRRDHAAPKQTGPGENTPHWIPLICQDCRTQELVTAVLKDTSYKPYFQGDPRGAVLKLYPVDTPHADIDSGRARGIYVPARS